MSCRVLREMSRSKKGSKGPGYEYWSARPGNANGGTPGKFTKRRTHKAERQQGKRSSLIDIQQ